MTIPPTCAGSQPDGRRSLTHPDAHIERLEAVLDLEGCIPPNARSVLLAIAVTAHDGYLGNPLGSIELAELARAMREWRPSQGKPARFTAKALDSAEMAGGLNAAARFGLVERGPLCFRVDWSAIGDVARELREDGGGT